MEAKDFTFDPLPEGFMMPKPVNSVKDEVILRLEKAGRLAITRKRNGYCVWAAQGNRGWKFYTRGLQDVTGCFPHIIEEFNKAGFPPNTFFSGEMTVQKNEKDDLPTVSRIFKTFEKNGAKAAVELQQKEIGLARYMIFEIVYWNGEKWINRPWRERYFKIFTALVESDPQYMFPVELMNCSFKKAQELVEQMGWEGLVLYDKEGCSDFSLNGKVERPRVAWKRKPVYEDDFIVRRWIPRKNDPSMVKEFVLSQIDSETGKEIDCGKCGRGLTNAQRIEFAKDALYPLVVEVKFYDRFPSGKLQFASVVRVRDDKKPNECIWEKEET